MTLFIQRIKSLKANQRKSELSKLLVLIMPSSVMNLMYPRIMIPKLMNYIHMLIIILVFIKHHMFLLLKILKRSSRREHMIMKKQRSFGNIMQIVLLMNMQKNMDLLVKKGIISFHRQQEKMQHQEWPMLIMLK